MNHGRIEQVGRRASVYNAPATEFIARFMGGHNVIQTGAGKLAVRNDHMRIAPARAARTSPRACPAPSPTSNTRAPTCCWACRSARRRRLHASSP
jgi:ABC-type Fe3+/spermidine/putrescine transport system ATPase subunit